MMAYGFLAAFLLLLCLSNTFGQVIDSSPDLEQYLCHSPFQELNLTLNSSNYNLSSGQFCHVVQQVISISSSSPNGSVITCVFNDTVEYLQQQRRGLVFFYSSVTITRVTFKHCGTFLNTISDTVIRNYLNSSLLQYTSQHAAALVFVHCQVNLTEVGIYYSFGFAMVGVNLYMSSIERLSAIGHGMLGLVPAVSGSGVVIHYLDTGIPFLSPDHGLSINISKSIFSKNYDYGLNQHCMIDLFYQKSSGNIPVINAAGLTILHTMKSNPVKVIIDNLNFSHNVKTGGSPGGLLVLHFNSSFHAKTFIRNSIFEHNVNTVCHGAGLSFYWHSNRTSSHPVMVINPLMLYNTTFRKQAGINIALPLPRSDYTTGAVFFGIINLMTSVRIQLHMSLRNCVFQKNMASDTGAGLYAIMYEDYGTASILLHNTNAKQNSQYVQDFHTLSNSGTFSFYGIKYINITGRSKFDHNYGSVFDVFNSNIYISGNVRFSNNRGINGAAINLKGNSHLIFRSEKTHFHNNHALFQGGAIFINLPKGHHSKCAISFDLLSSSNITFSNNTASLSGNSIYINDLHSCYVNGSYRYLTSPREIINYYHKNFEFKESSNKRLQIATQPTKIISCHSHNHILQHASVYPGQNVLYYLAALDSFNSRNYKSVYTPINIAVTSNASNELHQLYVSHEPLYTYFIKESPNNCTLISFRVHISHQLNKDIFGHVTFFLPHHVVAAEASITVRPCPLGFVLNNATGSCECSPVLDGTRCNIDNQIIERLKDPPFGIYWMGLINSSSFGVSYQCPFGHCNNVTLSFCSMGNYISLTQSKFTANRSCSSGTEIPICLNNRNGTLCGQCADGLSAVIGTAECKECSNWWLVMILVYTIAGPILIYLLYTLKLTLTAGTLNGIIFFAQVANCGIIDLLVLSSHNKNNNFVSASAVIFLSLLHLNSGLPVCLYNGMTELWKYGLSLLFPLYLLLIVVVLIFLSRYSVRLANRIADSSVQVLVTVVHISFSRLLLAIIDVSTPAEVYTANHTYKVWFFDGSVEYGSEAHFALMTITLTVVSALLLPYLLLLLFSKPLRRTKMNNYIRPFLEAVHAPYKEGKQYWFVTQLLLVILLYIVYALYRSRNVLYLYTINIPLLILYLVAHTYSKPFKSKAINVLYCWLSIIPVIIGSTSWYFLILNKFTQLLNLVSSLVFLVIVTFSLIIIYHVLQKTSLLQLLMEKINTFVEFKREDCYQRTRRQHFNASNNSDDSFYDSNRYREPLISSVTH